MPQQMDSRPGYNHNFSVVTIDPMEQRVGARTMEIFNESIRRWPKWIINRRNEIVAERVYFEPEDVDNPDPKRQARNALKLRQRIIVTNGLENESITPEFAGVIDYFKMVEDHLPDFMGSSAGMFRNIHGINRAYWQWGNEEGQHSDGEGLILMRTQRVAGKRGEPTSTSGKSPDEIETDYYRTLLKVWQPPFRTARMMTCYTVLQEPFTGRNYDDLEQIALEMKAPITAAILGYIKRDEKYHGGGAALFAQAFAKEDPEGTVDDMIFVMENFGMPAQELLDNRRRTLVNLVDIGYFDRERDAHEIFRPVLEKLGFLTSGQIQSALDNFVKNNPPESYGQFKPRRLATLEDIKKVAQT